MRAIETKRMRSAGHVARMGDRRGAYWVLVERPEERRPIVSRRREWEDNIKKDLQDMGWIDMEWINVAKVRERWRALVNSVMW